MANVRTLQEQTIIVNGYATEGLTREMLSAWNEDLTYLSLYTYGFTQAGQLVPLQDDSLIGLAQDQSIAPLMVLSPMNEAGQYSYDLLHTLFTNPVMRDTLIQNLVFTISEKQYIGLVFNFGYITPQDKGQFVITVSKTAERLNRQGALTIVSLAMGMDDAGIDYEALGQAANFIELRNFHWEQINGQPDIIFYPHPSRFLSDLAPNINVSRILLGIPNPTPAGTPNNDQTGAPETEQAHSLNTELMLVRQFGLAGLSIWTVMNPYPAFTDTIHDWFIVYKLP